MLPGISLVLSTHWHNQSQDDTSKPLGGGTDLLAIPASPPHSGDTLDGAVDRRRQTRRGREVDLPGAVATVPCLPVVHGDPLTADGIEEALAEAVLAVAVEGEGVAAEAAVTPGAVAVPGVGGDLGDSQRNDCERGDGELHVELRFLERFREPLKAKIVLKT